MYIPYQYLVSDSEVCTNGIKVYTFMFVFFKLYLMFTTAIYSVCDCCSFNFIVLTMNDDYDTAPMLTVDIIIKYIRLSLFEMKLRYEPL